MGPGKAVVEREQPCSGVEMGEGGPGKAVVEMEQPCSGVEMGACGPGKAVVEMEQPCSGVDMPKQQVLEETAGESENVGVASAPPNDDEDERITIEDVTDEEEGNVEDMDSRETINTKINKKKVGGVVQGNSMKLGETYDAEIEAHKEKRRKEALTRQKRIEKALEKEKNWEMMRELKRIIRENGGQWHDSEELRKEERAKIEQENELERERKKRMKKAGKQKQKLLTDLLLRELPEKKREILVKEEERRRRLELQEAKD